MTQASSDAGNSSKEIRWKKRRSVDGGVGESRTAVDGTYKGRNKDREKNAELGKKENT